MGEHPNRQIQLACLPTILTLCPFTRKMPNPLCSTSSSVGETPKSTSPVSFRRIQSAFCQPYLLSFPLQGKYQHVVQYLQYRWGNTPTDKTPSVSDEFSRLACQPYLLSFPLQGKCHHVVQYLQYRWGNTPTDKSRRFPTNPVGFLPTILTLSLYKGNANTLCSTCSIVGETPQPTSPVGFRQIQ
jgi:hypothetical protein